MQVIGNEPVYQYTRKKNITKSIFLNNTIPCRKSPNRTALPLVDDLKYRFILKQ